MVKNPQVLDYKNSNRQGLPEGMSLPGEAVAIPTIDVDPRF